MKKIILFGLTLTIALFQNTALAKIINQKNQTYTVYGNCSMCKSIIEKAGSKKNVSKVVWNEKTKKASITFDSVKTNQNEILKNIALAGYDNELYLAPNDTYANLHQCCQYTRSLKINPDQPVVETVSVVDIINTEDTISKPLVQQNTIEVTSSATPPQVQTDTIVTPMQSIDLLQPVYDNYFLVKDALVKDNSANASKYATLLATAIKEVPMEKMQMDDHMVWMKYVDKLTTYANSISSVKDIKKQREIFSNLSKNMYQVMKVIKPAAKIYYDYCPMYNANWLSKEQPIKNPYYGSQMLTCGSVQETIK